MYQHGCGLGPFPSRLILLHKVFVVNLWDTLGMFLMSVILKSENHIVKTESCVAICCGHLFWGRYEDRKSVKHMHKQ